MPIDDPNVANAFDRHPLEVRERLLHLRALILRTAQETADVGPLHETLKWGQPSYLTAQSRSGTTLRIHADAKRPGTYGLYVHCQSRVVEAAQDLGLFQLNFDGTRAVILQVDEAIPEEQVCSFIRLALTYHRWK